MTLCDFLFKLKRLPLIISSRLHHEPPWDTQTGVVINRAKYIQQFWWILNKHTHTQKKNCAFLYRQVSSASVAHTVPIGNVEVDNIGSVGRISFTHSDSCINRNKKQTFFRLIHISCTLSGDYLRQLIKTGRTHCDE